MAKVITKQISSLEKVFPNFEGAPAQTELFALGGESVSYQIAYTTELEKEYWRENGEFRVSSPLLEYIKVYKVGNVPSELPAYRDKMDDDYITAEPGMFPDPLFPAEPQTVDLMPGIWHSLWVEVNLPAGLAGGDYPVSVEILWDNQVIGTETMQIHVLGIDLPKQTLQCTQWFHVDCIADVHHVEIFSEAHWALIAKYMKMAADHGINMILTPVLTPPLDTQVGAERPTVQLVDITKTGDSYIFDFSRLARYVDMAKDAGIEYFEINQLYTQWGAAAAPKVVAKVDGEYQRIFGWDTPAQGAEYKAFLETLLPALVEFFDARGMQKEVVFHISDEPNSERLENYAAGMKTVRPLVKDYVIMDALSDFAFWQKGIVQRPVVAVDHIQPFLENNVEGLWCYYCCAQNVDVANRFFAMHSYRNRILGVQMYWYQIAGFLQWGYNFYYSALSRQLINPYVVTDGMTAFPSGDTFIVYPWLDGVIPSLRLKVFREALQDMRLLQLLEQYAGRDAVMALIEETAGQKITFTDYPRSAEFLLTLRQKAYAMLSKYIH